MKAANTRARFWLPLVVLALVVALALGGCARAAQNSSAPGSQPTSSSQTSPGAGNSSTNDELNHLQQVDQQNQNDLNGLNTDDQNANQNTGSDQVVQP